MKKQWLSMILALCMVLCLTPTTARAEEGETGTLRVTVNVWGLPDGVSAEGKTFTFKVGMVLPGGTSYLSTPLVIRIGEDGRTGEGKMEVTSGYKYLVVETAHDDINDYRLDYVTYPGGGYNESKMVWVDKNTESEPIYVNNGFEELANSQITSLPLTVAGYALNADVSAVTVTRMETGVTIQSFKIKQYNATAGSWDDLTSGTFQADTKYAIEIFLGKVTGCNYTSLTKDKVTVNGQEVSVFDNPATQPGGDMRVFHKFEVLKVVKKVDHIKITKEPDKTTYNAGDKFEPKGMEVTAVYKDDTTAVLPREKYVIFYGDKLTQGQTYVTIQYNDGSGNSGIKVDQKITVGPYVGDHQHTYDDSSWYQDAQSHWHQCTDTDCPDRYGSTKDLALHTFVWKVDKEATTTQTGLKHEECTVCGHKRSENTEIPLLTGTGVTTYPITVMSGKNGDVTASHKSASKGTTVTLTADPDKGYVLDTLTVLDGKDKEIKLTEKNGKYTFTMPASKVTVEAMFKATGNNPFIDVPAGSYYEDAVIWAVDKGITTGTDATHCSPDGICTRAQAVTFLWRAAGSPAAKSAVMPFADVKAGSYYETAVLWAVENGITKGTSDTMFSPDATCSRAQIVTFLWRANGSPAVSGNSAFTDVAADAYYAAAVTWAEKNSVTGGIGGGLFGSNNNCTRAQIVTFIWRALAE